MTQQNIFRYRNFTILKDQTLGHGSYGAVYKARCDQLMCAAKVLHPTIVDPYDPGSGRILQRFRQECDFLNHVRHPHIVQYLGVCRDPESNLPVLLMELLDESLTKMLERSQHPISYHIQLDLCHDISLAVAYLHSNGIIHRDLSGNNVLVIAGRRAKVTDFGMSKLVGSNRHMTPLTLCPGTLGYMSPESLKEPPRYTEKLDVFSEGVIMIQVCTQQFPDPGPAVKEVEDPRYPLGTVQVPISELERRKKHIDLIDPTHPLLPIVTECLEYREKDRPSAEELCQKLAALKENPEYTESSQRMTPATPEALKQEQNGLARRVEEKDQEIVAKNQEILSLGRDNNRLRMQLSSKDREIERFQIQLQELEQRLVDNEQVIAEFQKTHRQLLKQKNDLQVQNEDFRRQLKLKPVLSKKIEFRWRDGGNAPFCVRRGKGSSLVNGKMVRFLYCESVYSYDSSTGRWSTLPKCPQRGCGLAVIQGLLTLVGGETTQMETTNKLVSLNETRGEWLEQFPPMPTGRLSITAITYQSHLIVAGGSLSSKSHHDYTATVEVLNTDTLVWSTAASLPHPFGYASATICGDRLYMLGGNRKNGPSQSVFSCSLPELLRPQALSLLDKLRQSRVWQHDTSTPVYDTTCATVNGQLVAFGGMCDREDLTSSIREKQVYKYDPNTRSWNIISHMTTARSECYVAVLSTNQLIVVGGCVTTHGNVYETDSIEIADF